MMFITIETTTGGDNDAGAWLSMLAPPLAALLYPFALEGFKACVTDIPQAGGGALPLPWLGAAMCVVLTFAIPLTAVLAAVSLAGIDQPTAAQLRAKRMALLAVAAPTLFILVGLVLRMLHDPALGTWLWVACWALVLALLLRSDNKAPVSDRPPNAQPGSM